MDVGVHDFDTARWLLGTRPRHRLCRGVHNPVYRDADLDNAYVTIGHGGAVATTHLSRTSTIGMEIRCEVIGAGRLGHARPGRHRRRRVTVLSPASTRGFPADCRDRFAAAYQAQMDDFGAACRGEADAERDARGRPLGGGDGRGRARQRGARASRSRSGPIGTGATPLRRGLTAPDEGVATVTCGW